jgi:signal transduction histidine kinase
MLPIIKKLFGNDDSEDAVTPQDASHINQEVYKKSVEISERNKTLLLLRKIDEIILSSVTNQIEIARKVTYLLVTETDFQIASIFKFDKNKEVLERLASYEARPFFDANLKSASDPFYLTQIPLSDTNNIIVESIRSKMAKSANTLQNSLFTAQGISNDQNIQGKTGIKSVFAYPLMVRDQVIGSMVIALSVEEQNISEYTKDLLDRLVQVIGIAMDNASLYNDLQDANNKLKELDKLKDEFVYLASHELRTPMTSIKSYLWLALKGDAGVLNDKQKLYIDRAYVSTNRLIKLVNDMLNISRIESGRITIELQKVDIYKLVQEVVDEVQPRATELGINVVISPPPTLSPVLADPDKIKEVLINLIGNSLKFTPRDGSITVAFAENNEMVEIGVNDTGAGIAPESIPKLFQKFSMLADSYINNKNASGTGLGLYISRSIIELHHGTIWASSDGVGKGSKFTFALKAFNEKDLHELNSSENSIKKESVGIVHTQL